MHFNYTIVQINDEHEWLNSHAYDLNDIDTQEYQSYLMLDSYHLILFHILLMMSQYPHHFVIFL